MKKIKFVSIGVAALLTITCLFGCGNTDTPTSTAVPDETASPEEEGDGYAELSTEYVFKVGDENVYESEFYYFLYQGIRQVYREADGVYDENATYEENLKSMIAFFKSEAEDGETYLKKAVDITKQTAQGFKIAYLLGKAAAAKDSKYEITQELLDNMNEYIDSEAEYGATAYNCTADEYFFYQYGMKVNDLKRYSEQQLYAEMSETVWSDENGWSFDETEPTEPTAPTKPTEPDEDATEDEKKEYETELEEYNTKLDTYNIEKAQYDEDLKAYNKAKNTYFQKFKEAYEDKQKAYDIKTIRYLQLDKGDDAEAAKTKASTYIKYFKNGENFASLVKGFSDSTTATTDLGLVDIDVNDDDSDYGNLPLTVINWALDQNIVSTSLTLLETDDAYYLVKIEGITSFDKTTGITADEDITYETVRENVRYVHLAELYNTYIESFMDDDEYKISDENEERMMELGLEYLTYSEETDSSD